jgi:hypothetical protein
MLRDDYHDDQRFGTSEGNYMKELFVTNCRNLFTAASALIPLTVEC